MEGHKAQIVEVLQFLAALCHKRSSDAGWWHSVMGEQPLLLEGGDGSIFETNEFVVPTKLMLVVSEVVEALEGHRKGSMDDKLPHRTMIETEIADAHIRLFDLAGALKLDVAGAILEKLEFNRTRPDHQVATRRKPGGKKY